MSIIKQIDFAEKFDDINKPSLREQILNFKHPADFLDNTAVKKSFLDLKTQKGEELIFDKHIRKEVLGAF